MSRTIDLVVAGDGKATRAAAVDAARCGRSVLVVLRSPDPRAARRLRQQCTAAGAVAGTIRVMTAAEVVCVDGIDRVEAVVIRHGRTGRLRAVNASAFVSHVETKRTRVGRRRAAAKPWPP
ncbi:MAG: hypothetical protein R2745_19500 [Vicinamibacterales bacterium]